MPYYREQFNWEEPPDEKSHGFRAWLKRQFQAIQRGIPPLDVVDARDFDIDVRGKNDSTAALNRAMKEALDVNWALKLPPGKLAITDTTWMTGTNASTFRTARLIGSGMGVGVSSSVQTYIDATAITGKPAIAFQRGRKIYIAHIAIVGGNVAAAVVPDPFAYDDDWVTVGLRDSQFSPYCAIAMDPGVGDAPSDGGYDGVTYQGSTSGSQFVTLDHVYIDGFVAGLNLNSEDGALQGDTITIIQPTIKNCKVGISIGETQARAVNVYGGDIQNCRSIYSTIEYGTQNGNAPAFYGTQFADCFELMEHASSVNPALFVGCRGESINRLGYAVGGGLSFPTTFVNCDFHLLNTASSRAPVVFESTGPAHWIGGHLDGTSSEYAYNIYAIPFTMENVQVRMANRFRPFIGCNGALQRPLNVKNVRISQGSNSLVIGQDQRESVTLSGRFTGHWSETDKHIGYHIYDYQPNWRDVVRSGLGTPSNVVFTDTTLVFDTTDATSFLVGDIVEWRFLGVGRSVTQFRGAAARVTAIDGTEITCDLLWPREYYDEADIPSTMAVYMHEWAPREVLTGDIASGSPTISNVSPTTILQDGDWLTTQFGIADESRVSAGGGTATITMNRNATATKAGVPLYWGRLARRRTNIGVSPDNGDAARTHAFGHAAGTSFDTQVLESALTGNRAQALSTTDAISGDQYLFIRTTASTGAFTWDIGTGPLKSLRTGEWGLFKFNGTAWFLASSGNVNQFSSFFAPGSFTVPTGQYRVMASRLELSGSETATLEGTAVLAIV